MYAHNVEPFVLLCSRLEEFHIAISPGVKQPFVANITQAIQCELCAAFLEKHWLYRNLVNFWIPAKVVDKSRCLQQVQWREVAVTRRIVMIAMDGKHRYGNIDIFVFVIDMVENAAEVLTCVAQHF